MRIAVVGAGTMGHGIAQVAAMAGYETRLTDADPAAGDRALARIAANLDGAVRRGKLSPAERGAVLSRVRWCGGVEEAADGAQLVIEAIVERLDAKRELFRRLDDVAAADTILATNTSALPVGTIAAASRYPERVVGMHFFNPVHIMKLVEIVVHDRAAGAVVERVRDVATRLGKEPIVVRDTPGFASSRLGVVLGLEAMRMLEQGVANAEDIDKALELGYGHPMGPLKVSDLVGLDVRLAIAEHLFQELKQPHYEPPAILRAKVRAGELGEENRERVLHMAEHTVLTEITGRVATVTINRPEKRNALNTATRTGLIAALDELERNADVRVAILTGAGDKAFVAGADIGEFEGNSPVDQYRIMSARSVYGAADRFPKPLIAAINGYCLGGGCELAMACDIRIAADGAKFGQPEINLGIMPGGGGTQRLPRLVGLGRALRLLYTGEMIDAAEALRIGLADDVVPAAELMSRARGLAEQIAAKSPVALSLIKEAVRSSARMPLDEGLRHEATLFGLVFSSEDKREGVAAFLAKRAPQFTGR